MGNSGLASLLYHPMGFRPVTKVKEALAAGRAHLKRFASMRATIYLYCFLKEHCKAGHREVDAKFKLESSSGCKEGAGVRSGRTHMELGRCYDQQPIVDFVARVVT
ncbi:MAG TPA: hypothetical protein DEF35_00485 [Paenibacillus sp.]|uniref:hypothetical protein n=1 Tax=Paenibacillus TaxID=44249 RepID=UPI000BA054B5|nr:MULTISPECIES: hypothetical protein [Paenibacillus]OZQ72213.1 hypothetical protein CA599_07120 [Paenibacillus taichungensis]HBU80108.1 hypothetical protein [Paenibacillus sp.]